MRQWTSAAIGRLDHYKAAYHALLKEAITMLEFALWKANLDGNKESHLRGIQFEQMQMGK